MGISSSGFCLKRRIGSGDHLKVEPREFAVGLDLRHKRKRGVHDDITVVGLSNRKD